MASSLVVAKDRLSWLRGFVGPRTGGRRRVPWIPVAIMGVLLFCAVAGPLAAPHDPNNTNSVCIVRELVR